jgi:hypothetical protein
VRRLFAGLIGLCWCAVGAAPASAQQDLAAFEFNDATAFKVLRLDGNHVRWQRREGGAGLVLSYRIVSGPQEFPGARNCRKMTTFDALLAASDVAVAALRAEIVAAFAMWEAVADLRFREAQDDAPADILIGAQMEPEGRAFADVFYDAASPQRIKPISLALVCLNPTRPWKVGFDGDLKTYDLRYTLAHEIGHAIGLDHPNGAAQIMGYRYEERFRALQPGDVRGAVTLYGARIPSGVTVAAAQSGSETRRASAARFLGKRWGTRALNARSH